MRACLLVHRHPSSHCPCMTEGCRSSLETLIRALTPFMRAQSSWLNYLPKSLPPNTVTLGIGFQHMNYGEIQTFSQQHPHSSKIQWGGKAASIKDEGSNINADKVYINWQDNWMKLQSKYIIIHPTQPVSCRLPTPYHFENLGRPQPSSQIRCEGYSHTSKCLKT